MPGHDKCLLQILSDGHSSASDPRNVEMFATKDELHGKKKIEKYSFRSQWNFERWYLVFSEL